MARVRKPASFPEDFPPPLRVSYELSSPSYDRSQYAINLPAIPHSDVGALISRTVLGHNLGIMLKPELLVEMDGRFTAPVRQQIKGFSAHRLRPIDDCSQEEFSCL